MVGAQGRTPTRLSIFIFHAFEGKIVRRGRIRRAYLPEAILQAAGFLAFFAVISVLFAMMFKWLPDTPVGDVRSPQRPIFLDRESGTACG
jgi:hypothetical protein